MEKINRYGSYPNSKRKQKFWEGTIFGKNCHLENLLQHTLFFFFYRNKKKKNIMAQILQK